MLIITRWETRVRIPARDYNTDRSESEMACHYSNSRVPGDMCSLQYQTEHRRYQARPMCLSIAIIQGRVKCRRPITVPEVPTQEAIPEEGR